MQSADVYVKVDDVLVSCDVEIWIGRDVDRLR